MNIYTAHLHAGRPPVLVREGFSWGAFIFGPLWLLARGAWIAALLALAVLILACTLPPPVLRPILVFAVMLLLGLLGQDLRRGHLRLRRFALVHVVAARDQDEALFRLVAGRPDIKGLVV